MYCVLYVCVSVVGIPEQREMLEPLEEDDEEEEEEKEEVEEREGEREGEGEYEEEEEVRLQTPRLLHKTPKSTPDQDSLKPNSSG